MVEVVEASDGAASGGGGMLAFVEVLSVYRCSRGAAAAINSSSSRAGCRRHCKSMDMRQGDALKWLRAGEGLELRAARRAGGGERERSVDRVRTRSTRELPPNTGTYTVQCSRACWIQAVAGVCGMRGTSRLQWAGKAPYSAVPPFAACDGYLMLRGRGVEDSHWQQVRWRCNA